jgi:CHASE1-domain containing sensor protein
MHFDIEFWYTALLVGVFLLIGWFAVYVVYKLYQGQR